MILPHKYVAPLNQGLVLMPQLIKVLIRIIYRKKE